MPYWDNCTIVLSCLKALNDEKFILEGSIAASVERKMKKMWKEPHWKNLLWLLMLSWSQKADQIPTDDTLDNGLNADDWNFTANKFQEQNDQGSLFISIQNVFQE